MSEVNKRTIEQCKTAKHSCTTYLTQASASIEWTITNFNLLQIDSNCIESSSFESVSENAHTGMWKLKLFPKYTNEDKVGLFFVCTENQDSIFVKCEACIIDAAGKDTNKKELGTPFNSRDIGFSEFITRNELVESLLPNGSLTIRCSVTVTCRYQTQLKRNDDKFNHGCSLSQDISKLLKDESLSDVVLICQGRKFPVHKCVLSARSSVFSAMFTDDFKEKEESVVEIKDIEASIFENMLSYIYTDSIHDFTTVDMVIKLLGGADKYGLLELREICGEYLKKNVSIHNLPEVAAAADLHSLNSLKESCINFMCEHGREIVFSNNSKDLYFTAPQYFLEGVLKQLFGSQSPQAKASGNLTLSGSTNVFSQTTQNSAVFGRKIPSSFIFGSGFGTP